MFGKKKKNIKKLKKGEIYREKVNSQQGYEDWEFTGKTTQGPLGVYYAMENDRGVQWFSASELNNMKHQNKSKKILGAKNMADKKKKKATDKAKETKRKPTSKKTAGQRSERTPKKTAGQRAAQTTGAKKPVKKVSAQSPAAKKRQAPKKPTTKPLKHSDKEEMTVTSKKNAINININSKKQASTPSSKNSTKQVTERLPENAKLKTIHLHFKID